MSSSYRLQRRNETDAFDFGPDWSSHYLNPFTNCYPGDFAVEIGQPGGVKMCIKNRADSVPDSLVENSAKGKKINGLYKSYSLYNPPQEFQTRTGEQGGNPWPEGGSNRDEALRKDYIKVPIRYNGTGLENMQQISGQEFAYGWQVVDRPPTIPVQKIPWDIPTRSDPNWRADFDVTRLHSTQQRGDLRDQLYQKYTHAGVPPGKTDFYHARKVMDYYPEYQRTPTWLPGSTRSFV
jgi:hypothetical protein